MTPETARCDLQATPAPVSPVRRSRAGSSPAVLGRLQGTVLVAEDTGDLRELAVLYLKSFGLGVIEAVNGAEAVTLALRDQPDAILMDLEMPVLGGLEAAAQLRQSTYGGAIVALTGHSAASVRAQALAAGCNDLLSKPVSRAQLHAALERALRAPFGAAGTRP